MPGDAARPAGLPFRVGATSYVIEDDLVANARFLAGRVDDMQLVLFDLPGGPSNLPDAGQVRELAAIGRAAGLSYTVHLLDDLRPVGADGWRQPLARAQDVIARTQALEPWAYVLHLDGRDAAGGGVAAWQTGQVAGLTQLAQWTGDPTRLAVENLEGYPHDLVEGSTRRAGALRWVDGGHLWLDGGAASALPVTALAAAGERLRVVHLHGVGSRDHASLALTPAGQVDAVVRQLLGARFGGVVTLEVFGLDDFTSSRAALAASVDRVQANLETDGEWVHG